jgi:hypothetical protein
MHIHQASNILKDTTPQAAAVEKAFLTAKLAHDLQVRECVCLRSERHCYQLYTVYSRAPRQCNYRVLSADSNEIVITSIITAYATATAACSGLSATCSVATTTATVAVADSGNPAAIVIPTATAVVQQQGRPAAEELRARAVLLDVNAPVTSHLEHQLAGVQIAHGLAHRPAVEELKVCN